MSMKDVNRAFRDGLAGKATCDGGTMTWERDEQNNAQKQRLNFLVVLPNGTSQLVSDSFDGMADPAAKAKQMATEFAATLEGGV